jgi:uncharacterized protein
VQDRKSLPLGVFSFDTDGLNEYDGALMSDEAFSRLIDARKMGRKGIVLDMKVPLSELTRLEESVVGLEGFAKVDLAFDRDEEKRYTITGTVKAPVKVTCQRCLEPVEIDVKANVSLAVVWDDVDAQALPKHLDSLVVGEDPIDLAHLLEEELLLALPYVSYHESESCVDALAYTPEPEPELEKAVEPERENPFKILEQLKSK